MYQVKIEKAAVKALEKIDEPHYSKLKKSILDLSKNPRPLGYKKLKGREGYRIRVGDYRILYDIIDEVLIVLVLELGHLKDIYK